MEILEQLGQQTGPPTVQIWKTNVSTELAAKENLAKQEKLLKELVPQELHNYISVFDKKTAKRFPKLRPPSTLNQTLYPETAKFIPSLYQNNRNWKHW